MKHKLASALLIATVGVPCSGRVYHSAPGVNQNFIDTNFIGL
ncbi:MAG TPA: hypothetical protein VN493_20220 [Thermoanaerobaculia bacterium]|nr:hypothetical protein [Thermoanaerobaculia bacterium]